MEIELYSKIGNPVEAITQLGTRLAKSGMYGCDRAEQGMVIAMTCLTEKKSPMEYLRTYHTINGRPTMRSDRMIAEFVANGGKFKIIHRTADVAEVEMTKDGNAQTFMLTWEDAQKEPFTKGKGGQIKDNWATPRNRMQMLWARVISDGVRTMAPGVVAGVYTPEELEDTAPDRTINLATPAAAPVATQEAPKTAEPPTINVEATVTPQPTTAPAAGTPSPAIVTAQAGTDGKLTADTKKALVAALGESLEVCFNWLVERGWLAKDAPLETLSVKRAQRILGNPAGFIDAVKGASNATA